MGEPASGHGVNGSIAVVPDRQPLAADGIWRVTLAGEGFGRLVCRDERGDGSGAAEWHLLQLDEITDTQMEAYEAAMLQRE